MYNILMQNFTYCQTVLKLGMWIAKLYGGWIAWTVVALHNYLASQEAHCEGSIKVDLEMIDHHQSRRHGISARKQIPTKREQTTFHSVHHTLIWHSLNSCWHSFYVFCLVSLPKLFGCLHLPELLLVFVSRLSLSFIFCTIATYFCLFLLYFQ